MTKKIVVHIHTADGDPSPTARKLMEDPRRLVSLADDLADELELKDKMRARVVRDKIKSAIVDLTPLT